MRLGLNEVEKKNLIKFCHAERLKSEVLNVMQIFLKIQDYTEHKEEPLEGKTVLIWFLNALANDIARAVSVSQSPFLVDAQRLITTILQSYSSSGQQANIEDIMDQLRELISKITSEASIIAKELKF